MNNNTCNNDSCDCRRSNPSIECTVTQCVHHSEDLNYCTLDSITVVTHEPNPTEVKCTDCNNFRCK